MKAALTISRKRCLCSNEDFIKEHSEKYTFPSLPPVWKTLEVVSLVRFPNYFVYSRTIVSKSKWQESLGFLNTLTWKVG